MMNKWNRTIDDLSEEEILKVARKCNGTNYVSASSEFALSPSVVAMCCVRARAMQKESKERKK